MELVGRPWLHDVYEEIRKARAAGLLPQGVRVHYDTWKAIEAFILADTGIEWDGLFAGVPCEADSQLPQMTFRLLCTRAFRQPVAGPIEYA